MKKFFETFSLKKLMSSLHSVSKRFLMSIIILLLGNVLLFFILHGDLLEGSKSNIGKGIMSCVITFFMSVGLYLTCEAHKTSVIKKNIIQIFPIIFSIAFYFYLSGYMGSFENIVTFFLSLVGIIAYLFFAPYVNYIKLPLLTRLLIKEETKSGLKKNIFYSYFYKITTVFFTSTVLGFIVLALGSIGITSVEALFDLDIDSEITYWNWAIVSLAFIAPVFALTQMPRENTFSKDTFIENNFFSFLIKFIAIPCIIVYFIILYVYTGKVLVNFADWPKGEVSWLVIGFSTFGYIIYIFSYIFQKENKLIAQVRKIFPYIILPQIGMLFYAIHLRIGQYNITVNRYFVLVFGLWLLVISIYYILSDKKKLIIIPATLTLFTLIISVGPWGVYTLPESRQLERLRSNLEEANILTGVVGGKRVEAISPLDNYSDISKELSGNIASGIHYLCDFDNCNSIKSLFPKIYADLEEEDYTEWKRNKKNMIESMKINLLNKTYVSDITREDFEKAIKTEENKVYGGADTWTIVREISEKIKVTRHYSSHISEPKYITLRLYDYGSISLFPLDVKGYDMVISILSANSIKNSHHSLSDYAKIVGESMVIIEEGKEIESFSIKRIYDQLLKLYNKGGISKGSVSKKDLIFTVEGQKYDYEIVFQNINIPNPKYDKRVKEPNIGDSMFTSNFVDEIGMSEGIVLIKEK